MSESRASVPPVPQASPRAFFDDHRDRILAAIHRVLESGSYILGNEVACFEEEFARYFGFTGAVGVANGTDAIALALRALGIGPADRVATVSHTAVATVAAIEMVGAAPVFVDIAADTYTMEPTALERTLTAVKPVKAVIVVHLYGHPADMHGLMPVARRFGVPIIEDCAQSHGAKLDGQFTGSFGDLATFSFYPTKNLGAMGDGGMVVATSPEVIVRLRMLREYGWRNRFISDLPGVNSRLHELQAAVLREKLPLLEGGNRRRASIASTYNSGLAGSGLLLPVTRRGAAPVFHQYVVRHPHRDQLKVSLESKSVGASIHYPVPVHLQPAYAGRFEIDPGGLKVTEQAAHEVLSLPMYPELSEEAVQRVVHAVCASL